MAEIICVTEPWNVKRFCREAYRILTELHDQTYSVFAKNDLDVILMPTAVTPAAYKGQFYVRIQIIQKYAYSVMYIAPWNVIRYPAGCVPVTLVREGETDYTDDYNDRFTK